MADATTDPTSTPELIRQLTEQSTRLVQDEIALAKAELADKARHAGIGAGLFSAAGVLALFGLGTLIATTVLALAEALAPWLAALIVALVILAAAGAAAFVGRKQVASATPAVPEETVASVRRDVEEIKEARQREH